MPTASSKEVEILEREIQKLLDVTRAENEALKKLIEALGKDELRQKTFKKKNKPKNRKS